MMLWNPARRSISGPPSAVSSSSDHPEAASIRTSIGAPAFPADPLEAAAAAADSAAWSTTAGGFTRVTRCRLGSCGLGLTGFTGHRFLRRDGAAVCVHRCSRSRLVRRGGDSTAAVRPGGRSVGGGRPPGGGSLHHRRGSKGVPLGVDRHLRQRRAAIRNGHLLDDVFQALDGYGRTHDASLFHPEERGRYSILFDGHQVAGRARSRTGR